VDLWPLEGVGNHTDRLPTRRLRLQHPWLAVTAGAKALSGHTSACWTKLDLLLDIVEG